MTERRTSLTSDESGSSRDYSALNRELDELLESPNIQHVSQTSPALSTTPNSLNTAFVNETTSPEHSQNSLSQQQSQTTKDASSAIHGVINTIVNDEQIIIDLTSPTIPVMVSTGTEPITPIMVSTGTMPTTPTTASRGTMPSTPTMVSQGTMPKTPTMVSTGTMPTTPTMASRGTMPITPTNTDNPN